MRITIMLFLGLAIVAYKPQSTPANDSSPQPLVKAGAVDATPAQSEKANWVAACPTSDFAVFAEKFAGSISLQTRYTQWPLESTTTDVAATPEPKLVTTHTNERDISYTFLMAFDRAIRGESP